MLRQQPREQRERQRAGQDEPRRAALPSAIDTDSSRIFINLVNIVAVLLFVYRFGWGIAGIGAATAAADFCGFVLGVAIDTLASASARARATRDAGAARHARAQASRRNQPRHLRAHDLPARFVCLVRTSGARQGDAILAANALLLNFQTFMAFGLDGFTHAAEALVGAAAGARDRHAFRQAVKITLLWSATGAVGFSIVYWVGGEWIIGRLTDQAVVHAAAMRYLPWAAMLPLASVAGFQLDGVFIGATRTHELMNAMAVSLAVFLLAAWALAGSLGNHGLWLVLTLFMVARGITLAVQVPAIERAGSGLSHCAFGLSAASSSSSALWNAAGSCI